MKAEQSRRVGGVYMRSLPIILLAFALVATGCGGD